MKSAINAIQVLSKACIVITFLGVSVRCFAQENDYGQIHGNFQSDVQVYRPDSLIPNVKVPVEKALMNGFANIRYTKGKFTAGLRYESYLNAIQGFDSRYRGNGVPFRFASYQSGDMEVTVGNFYEQFGNGIIFRSYEERGLGVDNAMDGIRLKYQAAKGIYFKGVYGKQRFFFTQGPGIVRGGDAEIQIHELLENKGGLGTWRISLGAGLISKYQADLDPNYVLPQNVTASSFRLNIGKGGWNFMSEYAYKINDPGSLNNFIYKKGECLLLGANYSTKGFGFNASAKYVDNMGFHSDRTETGNNLMINFIPPITKQHTYLMMAFYPYATQNAGEVGAQAELFYKIKKGSALGGKYGTELALNFSKVHGLDKTPSSPYEGYSSEFGSFGKNLYFQDINFEVSKKFSKKFKSILTLANIKYNQAVIEGRADKTTLNNYIVVGDFTYYISDTYSLRCELQNMSIEGNHDKGSWAAALLEFTVAPKWFVSFIDQYNYGNQTEKLRAHYLLGQVAYVKDANRFSLSYGRQREGILCVGGVCRLVPGIYGLTLTVTSSF